MTFEEFAIDRLDRLLRTAWAICGDHGLAEDLVQDVLLKVQVRWDQIAAMDNSEAYVRAMLVNQHLSWRRRWRRVRPSRQVPEPTEVADHADLHAERASMREALSRLPRQQRAVLALRYYEGLTDAEIATVMGCSPGTVRGYASRALATLRTNIIGTPMGVGERDE